MIDVQLPTTDDRTLILSRYTEPERDQPLLQQQLHLQLPEQPPPRITADLMMSQAASPGLQCRPLDLVIIKYNALARHLLRIVETGLGP